MVDAVTTSTREKQEGLITMDKKNKRRVSVLIAAQTLWHLYQLAYMAGFGTDIGKIIDKLVREKMLSLSASEKMMIPMKKDRKISNKNRK